MTPEERIAEIANRCVSAHFRVDGTGSALSKSVQLAIFKVIDDPILTAEIRNKALEDAAKCADDYARKGGNVYARHSGRGVANAIRKLKSKL